MLQWSLLGVLDLISVGGIVNIFNFYLLVGFPLVTQKGQTLWLWSFAEFSNLSLDKYTQNLVFLPCLSLHILDKTQKVMFPIYGFLVKSLITKNYHNSRTSNDINMKLESLTKIDNRRQEIDQRVMPATYKWIFVFLIYGQFLEQPGSSILDAWSIVFKFLLKITFYLTNTESRTKTTSTELSHYCFKKDYPWVFYEKMTNDLKSDIVFLQVQLV